MILPSPVMISMAMSTRGEEGEGKTERRADSTDDEHEEHVIPVIARVTVIVISWRRRILVLICREVVMCVLEYLPFYLRSE